MNKTLQPAFGVKISGFALAAAAMMTSVVAAPVQAAPNQVVVVVAEGLTPQVIDLGAAYVKATSTESDVTIGFNDLKALTKSVPATGDVLGSMNGILKTAEANGYRTGFVTTGDVTKAAGSFYGIPASTTDVASALVKDSGFDFLAGGGRAAFVPKATAGSTRTDETDVAASIKKAGGTTLLTAEEFEGVEEVKGRVLALQADGDLSYALDNEAETETGLSDLASLAMTTLAGDEGNSPYVLVIHNANLLKALNAKDTPALLGEVSALDGIVTEVLSVRESKETPEDLAFALFSTGAASAPKYTVEAANGRSNAVFIVSKLPSSYSKATTTLKGATEESFNEFATEYGNWKASDETRTAVIGGTMTGEEAVRASFEPAIAIGYEALNAAPTAWVVGISNTGDVIKNIATIASTKAK